MKIRILCIGKIKEPYLRDGINEYLNRLKPYCQMEIVEVNDEPVSDKPNDSEIESVKNKEGNKVSKLIKPGEYVIALDLGKKQLRSPEFAKYIEDKYLVKDKEPFKGKPRTCDLHKQTEFIHQSIYRGLLLCNNEKEQQERAAGNCQHQEIHQAEP